MTLKLDNVEIVKPTTKDHRMSIMLWGNSGCGKTTLAATAPGEKLWLSFDMDGVSSIAGRDDVHVADYSTQPFNVVQKFLSDNAGGLDKLLEENPDIKTVVVDSVSSFNEMALKFAADTSNKSSIIHPTIEAYGKRNTYTIWMVNILLRVTAKHGRHIIFIMHESTPDKDEITGALFISVLVGGKLPKELPIRFSEVWYLEDTGKEHLIRLRNTRVRSPMKTRMFDTSTADNFTWKFDPVTFKGATIDQWYSEWKQAGFNKIPLPK